MMTNFSANASMLGYFYQVRYALYLLLKVGRENPNIEISIEKLDDVAFEKDGEPIELIQLKHHTKSTGSLSNASTDLWKTLRIWSSSILEGKFNFDHTYFTIITTGIAPENSAASKLRPESNFKRDTKSALTILKEVANTSENDINKTAYQTFLTLSDKQKEQLLKKIIVLDGSSDITDVKDEIRKELLYSIPQKYYESIFTRLEGWWINRVIKQISNASSSNININELLNKIFDLQTQFGDDILPIDFPDSVDLDEKDLSQHQRIFIEQLKLVSVGNPRIRKAISDYWRAFQQRSKWIREDLLLIDESEIYEKRLIDEWERRFEIIREDLREPSTDDSKVREGRALFNWIDEQIFEPIRPKCTHPYIQRGSYHILSNDLRVGWHIDFVERLQHLLVDLEYKN